MKLNPYYTSKELKEMGFRALGRQVLISRTCRIYTPEEISLGSHVLIDDFTILNGDITIGSYVHINSNCELYAGLAKIVIGDFCSVSSRTALYATSDDFSGAYLSNPTAPRAYRNPKDADVVLEDHVLIGTGCTVVPGVHIAEGCAFSAMTMIGKSIRKPWGLYAGNPARRIWERSRDSVAYGEKLMGAKKAPAEDAE